MKKGAVIATNARRSRANCVSRARLMTKMEKRCSGRDLALELAATKLSHKEARDWYRDLKAARKFLKVRRSRT